MSTQRNKNRKQFWIVVLGLFLFIGLIAGGTYLLEDQGVISMGSEMQDGPPANRIASTDSGDMPARPDHDGQEAGFNSGALLGLAKVLIQMSVVVAVFSAGQWMVSWVQRRRRRMPVALG